MAQQNIDFGNFPNDPSADAIRSAFQKTQENFTDLYTLQTATGVITINQTKQAGISVNQSSGNVLLSADLSALNITTTTLQVGLTPNTLAYETSVNNAIQTLYIDLRPDSFISNSLTIGNPNAAPNVIITNGNVTATGNIYANNAYITHTVSAANIISVNANIENLYADYANIAELTVTDSNISNTNITNANIQLANIVDANISNANISNANIQLANVVDVNITGNANVNNLSVLGITYLGPVENVHIDGGSPYYFLSTDGAGNLSWGPTDGATGATGATGPQGATGLTGPTGATGIGETGATGVIGPSGATGPAGQSTSFFNYNADTLVISGNPGSGNIAWDNASQLAATTLLVNMLTTDNVDIDVFLALLAETQQLLIQDSSDSDNFQQWTISGTPTAPAPNTYWEIPVVLAGSGGVSTFTNGQSIILALVSGVVGPSGATGLTGATGATGITGLTGATGIQGATGTAGTNGLDGATGATGIEGPSGATGPTGATGNIGPTGPSGATGVGATGATGDRYATSSTSTLAIGTGSKSLTVGTGLAYSINQVVRISYDINNYMDATVTSYNSSTGAMIASSTAYIGSGTYSSWTINLAGAAGSQGPTGPTGATGVAVVAGAYVHTQSSASTTWTINHNLGYQYVNVEPIDSTGNSYVGRYDYPTVTFTNTNTTTLTFASAVSGWCAVTSGGGQVGPSGATGPSGGPTGATGATGATGVKGTSYDGVTSTTSLTPAVGVTQVFLGSKQGAYTTGDYVTVYNTGSNYFRGLVTNIVAGGGSPGQVTFYVLADQVIGGTNASSWTLSIAGVQGSTGVTGATGVTGPTGATGIAGPTGATGPASVGGSSNTQVIFNDSGSANGTSTFTYDKSTSLLSLGSVFNLSITGGNLGYVLTTNGSGGLSWSFAGAISQYYRTISNVTVTGATATSVLGLASGVSLTSGIIYQVDGEFRFTSTGLTSHTENFGLISSTGTTTDITIKVTRQDAAKNNTGLRTTFLTDLTNTNITNALTTAQDAYYRISGHVAVTTGGSFNPQIKMSVDPVGTQLVLAGAWFRFTPVGTTGSVVNIGSWS